jgi:ABC-type phosphate transport system permease subunit
MDRNFNRKIGFYLIYFIIIILILVVVLFIVMRSYSRKQENARINLWNGTWQNSCSHPTTDKGYIGLQSEGSPVESRDIWLEYFPSIK